VRFLLAVSPAPDNRMGPTMGEQTMSESHESPAYRVLRASSRRLLQFIEHEIERQGGVAMLYNDQLAVCGSRRILRPGMRELHALGLVAHQRGCKCSIITLSERWRDVNSTKQAIAISATARENRHAAPVRPQHADLHP
jgi:hypothetical protein